MQTITQRSLDGWRQRKYVVRTVRQHRRDGFTLIELLVVMAVISVLLGLLVPAVQSSREAARRINCQANLKQMGLALQSFHDSFDRFPAGKHGYDQLDHSWCTFLLSFLEQAPLQQRIDLHTAWDDSAASDNQSLTRNTLPLFLCPSAPVQIPGGSDYCGIAGGTQGGLPIGSGRNEALGSGVLVTVDEMTPEFVAFRDITDGTSNTICISESTGRNDETGRWGCGNNLVVTDVNPINTPGKLASFHPGGVNVLQADGSGSFLSSDTSLSVLGALSTRNGGEVLSR